MLAPKVREVFLRTAELGPDAILEDSKLKWKGPPRCGMMNLLRAELASRDGDWDVAEKLYRESLSNWQDNAYSVQHKAFELREFGTILIDKGRIEDAVKALNEAIILYDRLGDSTDLEVTKELRSRAYGLANGGPLSS